jgi:uncharacterized membrane protein YciS (DUF1049 family)
MSFHLSPHDGMMLFIGFAIGWIVFGKLTR